MSGNKIYQNYISTHFGKIHDFDKEKDIAVRLFRRNYLPHMPRNKDARILDLGCGMGHFLYALEKVGYRNYLGIDISDENIDFCRKRGFNVEKADLFEFLQSNNDYFDVVILSDVIEHIDIEEGLRLMGFVRERLSPKGIFFVATPNVSNPILGLSSRYDDITHKTGFTELSLSQILSTAGFNNIRIVGQDIYVFYLNPFNYIAKLVSKVLNLVFRTIFLLYGRKTTKIFTKHLIGIAKNND